ncbi:caspase family protein [Paraburkholderia caledonica]|uniref:caspase family protein n=1 Tax=Paraburkholderia caledonica TaxID=134536 RepID=UPI000B404EE2|nr:caspase family protein [Paraburkholderia caledonica]
MRRVAFLVGNANFDRDSGLQCLRFPLLDVESLRSLLKDPAIGAYDRVVITRDATKDEILNKFATLLDEERGATTLFYYSGHGKVSDSGKLFLAAKNSTDRLITANGVAFRSLIEIKDDFGCGRFCAILDCCYAGLGADDIKGSEDDQLRSAVEGKGIYFLGAATSTSVAKEDVQLGHGFLTAAILAGLETGRADVDLDGRISGPDLFSWCRDFAVKRAFHLPVQATRVSNDDLAIAYSKRHLPRHTLDLVRRRLFDCMHRGLLPEKELSRLISFYMDADSVPFPTPSSLEDDFLSFTAGELTLDELLGQNDFDGRTSTAKSEPLGSGRRPAIRLKAFFVQTVTKACQRRISQMASILRKVGVSSAYSAPRGMPQPVNAPAHRHGTLWLPRAFVARLCFRRDQLVPSFRYVAISIMLIALRMDAPLLQESRTRPAAPTSTKRATPALPERVASEIPAPVSPAPATVPVTNPVLLQGMLVFVKSGNFDSPAFGTVTASDCLFVAVSPTPLKRGKVPLMPYWLADGRLLGDAISGWSEDYPTLRVDKISAAGTLFAGGKDGYNTCESAQFSPWQSLSSSDGHIVALLPSWVTNGQYATVSGKLVLAESNLSDGIALVHLPNAALGWPVYDARTLHAVGIAVNKTPIQNGFAVTVFSLDRFRGSLVPVRRE